MPDRRSRKELSTRCSGAGHLLATAGEQRSKQPCTRTKHSALSSVCGLPSCEIRTRARPERPRGERSGPGTANTRRSRVRPDGRTRSTAAHRHVHRRCPSSGRGACRRPSSTAIRISLPTPVMSSIWNGSSGKMPARRNSAGIAPRRRGSGLTWSASGRSCRTRRTPPRSRSPTAVSAARGQLDHRADLVLHRTHRAQHLPRARPRGSRAGGSNSFSVATSGTMISTWTSMPRLRARTAASKIARACISVISG